MESKSLAIAKGFLGKRVKVICDRPLGTKHPKHGFVYEVNYGYVPGVIAPDGEELDAYFLATNNPISEAEGVCIAIIHRENDDDDKLVVVPEGTTLSDEEIRELVAFQEKWFVSSIILG